MYRCSLNPTCSNLAPLVCTCSSNKCIFFHLASAGSYWLQLRIIWSSNYQSLNADNALLCAEDFLGSREEVEKNKRKQMTSVQPSTNSQSSWTEEVNSCVSWNKPTYFTLFTSITSLPIYLLYTWDLFIFNNTCMGGIIPRFCRRRSWPMEKVKSYFQNDKMETQCHCVQLMRVPLHSDSV